MFFDVDTVEIWSSALPFLSFFGGFCMGMRSLLTRFILTSPDAAARLVQKEIPNSSS